MVYRKALTSLALICGIVAHSNAQYFFGIATGDYSVVNKMFINPSSISDAKERIEVNLSSFSLAVDNNLGTLTKFGDLTKGHTDVFKTNNNTTPFSMIIPAIQLRLPAIVVSLDDKMKQSFGLSMRIRAVNQFSHFDPSLYRTITNADYAQTQNYIFTSSNFNWTAHAWSELGASYGLQVFNNGPHSVKAGVTLKYLGGIDYLSMKGKHLEVSYKAGSDTMFATNSDLEFASNAISSNEAKSSGLKSSDVTGSLFGSKAGSGFGMDIGVTYTFDAGASDEFGPKDGSAGHRIVVSAAVTDFGSVKYKGGDNFFVNVSGNGYLTGKGLSDNLDTWEKFRAYAVSQGFHADTGSKPQKVYLPTAFNVSADYQVVEQFFVNAMFIGNLANRNRFGNSIYNQVTVTPRYERRLFTVGLPITYSSLAKDLKIGFGFRLAGFFFGSDDMLALFSNNQHGFGFYTGGFVPIYKKKHKDITVK